MCVCVCVFSLTEVLDGVVALLAVDSDGLRVRAADAVADDVAAHQDVRVQRGGPAHDDAVGQRPHVQRARLVRDLGLYSTHNTGEVGETSIDG